MIDEEDDGTRTINLNNLLATDEERTGYLMILSSAAPAVMGKLFKLDKAETFVGRARECEICIEDDSVSRRHARLVRSGDSYQMQDLGSANGTYVNGQRVPASELKPGDKIQVGSTTVLIFSLHDRLEEQFQARVYEAATHDALTEVFNRKYLEEALAKEFSFASRQGTALSVVMVDIDHFKAVNDTHGHLAGDNVLRQVARLIRSVVREEDIVARYGGEEFMLVLRETGPEGALRCGERCRMTVALAPMKFERAAIPVTISVGVATLQGGNFGSAEALVQAADSALYRAKSGGRNRVEASGG